MKKRLEALADRVSRSPQVFLAVVIVLCAIEVAVDWNQALFEINVLRTQQRQKGENYADLLRKAAESAVAAYDWDELERLAAGVFDDDEVVYVRVSDANGNLIYDRLRAQYGAAWEKAHQKAFREYFRHALERDTLGLLSDPVKLRERMQRSRYRDLLQVLADGQRRLLAGFSPPPPSAELPRVLFQDRLADDAGLPQREISWALGAVTLEGGDPDGVVLIAFRNDKLNGAIRGKLWKGLAVTLFFVGLILVQNIFGRRDKLRLYDLEAGIRSAREAIRGALPKPPELAGLEVGVAFAQAERVGGAIYDLRVADGTLEVMVAVPEGHGVDAAFASVALRELWLRLPARATPEESGRELVAAFAEAPHARPIALLIARVRPGGKLAWFADGLPAPLEGAAIVISTVPEAKATAGSAQAIADAIVAAAVKRHGKKHPDDFVAIAIRSAG